MTSENDAAQDELIGETLETEGYDGTPSSLYKQIGEDSGIHLFVEQFYHAIISEPMLKEFFEGRELEGLKTAQKEFLAIILGGRPPLDYWDIITSDAPTNLSLEHTDLMIEYAEAVLMNMGLNDNTIKSIVRLVSPFIEAFINGSSKFQRVNTENPDESKEEIENARMFRDLIEQKLIESQTTKTFSSSQAQPSQTSSPTSDDGVSTDKDINTSEELMSRLRILLSDLDSFREGNLNAEISIKSDDLVGKIAGAIQSAFSEFRSTISSLSQQSEAIRLDCDELKQLLIQENEKRLNAKKNLEEQPSENRLSANISQAYKLSSSLLDKLRTLNGPSPEIGNDKVYNSGLSQLREPLHALISHNQELQVFSRGLREASSRTATLALNASLEAVRAGQQGKCFNVLALEMKEVARDMDELASGLNKTFKACRYYAYESLEHLNNLESPLRSSGIPSSVIDELKTITELLGQIDFELSEELHQKQHEELNKVTYSIEERQEASRFAEKLYQLGKKTKELKSTLSKYAV
ncbi:MAG: hypothetical protein GYA55_13235 [SAR324 cluster bacterium]|uniref:Methyl-accepting transducer domain-containing protein n=1 Tax=SAR324 cluster bacterium TaxID=2024889 RepID=A0A7X9FUI0_9DELT|nr:hypothetical protein [SAR324 cluster bacterium]